MNVTKLDEDLAVAPQPRLEDPADIAAAGFRDVINNRPDGEDAGQPSSTEMAAEASRAGMTYWHVPIRPGEPTPDGARRFAEAVRGAGGPVLAYCGSGNRSPQLWQLAQQLS